MKMAVVGGGPIGLEVAARALRDDWDVQVFERGVPGDNVAQWGHVRFFSPWRLNRSPWGAAMLREAGVDDPDADAFPTGREYLETYLRPLAGLGQLRDRIHTGVAVHGIARRDALKGDLIADPARDDGPFLLRVVEDGAESYREADVVVDASGVFGQPRSLGPGGLEAIGESAASARIQRKIPDVFGVDHERYAGRRVLVVGAGHSAATTLKLLEELAATEPATQIAWVFRQPADAEPFARFEDDPLPERDALSAFANRAATGRVAGITPVGGAWIHSVLPTEDGALEVTLEKEDGRQRFVVDEIVSNVGYRPNLELARELQVHLCYASEGIMNLAAALLGEAGGDCLQQESKGLDTLLNPEPSFFVAGSKSYGRNSSFLLRVGFEQIETIFDHLAD